MPKCDFNKIAETSLLKSHFSMSFLLQIYCIVLEHLFLRTHPDGCFWIDNLSILEKSKESIYHQISFHEITSSTVFFWDFTKISRAAIFKQN